MTQTGADTINQTIALVHIRCKGTTCCITRYVYGSRKMVCVQSNLLELQTCVRWLMNGVRIAIVPLQ